MPGIIGEAFVKVRPELRGFRSDLRGEVTRSTHGLGKILGIALGTGVGFGLERALEGTVDRAKEAEVVSKRLETAVKAQGISWQQNADYIESNVQALAKLSSFDDEELKQTFIQLLRRTGDVNKALQLNALSADVARGANLPLITVAKAIGRAYDGQTAGLTRLGVAIKKGTSGTEALRIAQEKYAGAAESFSSTAEGAQQRFNKTLNDSREIIGGALLPVISQLSAKFADYLEKENESGDLQRKVNTLMQQGTQFAHALGDAFDTVRAVVSPLVAAVGGLGNALQLALGLKLASLLRGGIASFGLLGASVARTAEVGVAEATAFDRAWTAATRPRNMIVTTTVTGAGGAGGRGGAGGAGGGTGTPPFVGIPRGGGGAAQRAPRNIVQRINQYGRKAGLPKLGPAAGLPTGLVAGIVLYGGFATASAQVREATPAYNFATNQWFIVYRDPSGRVTLTETSEDFIKKTKHHFWQGVQYRIARLRAKATKIAPPPSRPDEGTRGAGAPAAPPATKAKPPAPRLTTLQNLRLRLAAAERKGDLRGEKLIQEQIVGIYQARVDNTKLKGKALYQFKVELGQEEDKAQNIQDAIDTEAKQKASERQAAREKRASDAQTRQDKADQKLLRRLERGRTPFERAIERAGRSAGTKDNIAAAKALRDRIDAEIKIVKTSVKSTETRGQELDRLYGEREAAITAIDDAKKARTKALKGTTTEATTTRQDQLDKIIQIAELTDDPGALEIALNAAIVNARRLLKKAEKSGKGVLDAMLKLRTLQKQKRDLLKQGATGGGQRGTTAFDLLTGFAQRFQGGNLINAQQPFVGPSGFVADIAQFLKRQPGVTYPGTGTGSTTTGGLTAAESSIEKLIAALDRNTAGKEPSGHPPPARNKPGVPTIDPSKRVSRGGGRYYEAARARENVETRGGV